MTFDFFVLEAKIQVWWFLIFRLVWLPILSFFHTHW